MDNKLKSRQQNPEPDISRNHGNAPKRASSGWSNCFERVKVIVRPTKKKIQTLSFLIQRVKMSEGLSYFAFCKILEVETIVLMNLSDAFYDVYVLSTCMASISHASKISCYTGTGIK